MIAAELGGELVGYGSSFALGSHLRLEELAVRRAWEGSGIDRPLVEHYLAAALWLTRCHRGSLIAFQTAEWAVRLYHRLGFVTGDAYPGTLPNPELLNQLVKRETAAGLDASRRQLMSRPKLDPPADRAQS